MSPAARFRYTLVAGATAVVIGTGFTIAGLTSDAGAEETVPSAARQPLSAASSEAADSATGLLPDVPASPSASPSPTPSATPSLNRTKTATTPRKSPTPKKTTVRPKATTVPETGGSVLEQVLAHINAARAAEGLGALTLDTKLSKASALHNQLMIDGCGLSHQCPGESGLGARFSAQGVQWSSAGENIGYGSSGAGDSAKIKAANGLTDSMLAEVPPNDGHRKNLLNPKFKRIGLSVLRDSKGITWMTQDFVG
jgi:uncharacterized protein YkwD